MNGAAIVVGRRNGEELIAGTSCESGVIMLQLSEESNESCDVELVPNVSLGGTKISLIF